MDTPKPFQAPADPNPAKRNRARGFSLIELLTAVSIMVVIIFALYAIFNQTQKALRSNITQVDVLETGRATAEMLGRELEQLSASELRGTINLRTRLSPVPPMVQMDTDEKRVLRTNLLQELFFLRRETNMWVGTGYRVMEAGDGVGTLYRFTISTNYYSLNPTNLTRAFESASLATNALTGAIAPNLNRVADGIVHFKLTAYDPDGRRLGWETTNTHPTYKILRLNRSGGRLGLNSTAGSVADAGVILQQTAAPLETQFSFVSNSLPGYLEIELGVLEPAALKQYESLRSASAQVVNSYMKKQAAKVHLFRQRIPIRTALQ